MGANFKINNIAGKIFEVTADEFFHFGYPNGIVTDYTTAVSFLPTLSGHGVHIVGSNTTPETTMIEYIPYEDIDNISEIT